MGVHLSRLHRRWRKLATRSRMPSAIRRAYALIVDAREGRPGAGSSQPHAARAAGVLQSTPPYESDDSVPSPESPERPRPALAVRPTVRVEQHRESIRALVAEHHAVAARIFGSVARGDDEPGSDVDLLVDFTDEASLSDEIGLRLALADLLGVDVDVIAMDTLRGRMGERVLLEALEV